MGLGMPKLKSEIPKRRDPFGGNVDGEDEIEKEEEEDADEDDEESEAMALSMGLNRAEE